MKQIRPIVSGLVATWVLLAMVATATAQTVQQGIIKVVGIQGSARYFVPGSSTPQPLKVGNILKPGSVIQTAGNSHVDLVLNNPNASETSLNSAAADVVNYKPRADQDSIRVMENTVLGVDKLTISQTGAETVTDTQLDLKVGKIFGTVKKLSAASKYEVKIPNGVAGIRGTIYFLSADGVLSVVSGSVILSFVGPDGSVATQVVVAGQQYDAATGRITPIPDSLMQELIRLAQGLEVPHHGPPILLIRDMTIHFVSPTVAVTAPPPPPPD